ncbi:hypothetical protein CC79DRAFT_1377291 [Sarocladium strictum]
MNMPRLGEEERDSPCALPELVESDAAAMGRTSDYYTATEALDWHLSMEEDTWYLPVNLSPGYSSLSLSSTFSESVATRHPPEQSICLDNEKMPSCSFAAFKSIRQPSAAMLMGGFKKWRHLQTYLLHLSSKQGVVQDALLCLEDILSHELGMQSSTSSDKDMTSDARFQHAKDHLIQVCSGNEDEMSSKCLEHLLAALYLLAWVEVIRLKQPERTEETTFPSEQADMIIVQGDGKWNRYSRQLLSCFNSLDAKACHLGGSPILSEKALAVVSRYPIQITDCGYDDEANDGAAESKETLVLSSSPNEPETFQQGYYHPEEAATAASQLAKGIIDTKQVVLRAVLQPVAEWYLRTQVYFRHITCLDKHRRPRFTPEDELQVSLRGRQIQSELEDLWEERPTIVSLTAADLAQTMAPDVASRMHEVFGVYLASYWILFVYLHRVCWWHLPHTTTVTNALSQTWKNLQSSYSSSEEETEEEQQQEEGRRSGSHLKKKKKRTVHPALMWPVFIYGSETMCDSEQKWAVEQIKRLALPRPIVMESDGYKCSDRLPPLRLSQGVTQNALRAGMLLEALIIQQRSSGARVDIRDLAVDMFGCFFSIV